MSLEDRLYPFLPIYHRLPSNIRGLAGNVFRALPERVRFGRQYAAFKKLADQTFDRSADSIRSYQEEQIHSQLGVAWAHCPAYREAMQKAGVTPKDFRQLEDLEKFPIVTREDLLANLEGYRNQRLPMKQALYITTAGSTGQPVGFYLERGVSRPKEQAYLSKIWEQANFREGSRVLVLQGQVMSSEPDGRIHRYEPSRNRLFLSVYHLNGRRLPEYLRLIEEFQPQYILAYPSSALELLSLMEKAGETLGVRLEGLLCSSERLTGGQRKILGDFYQSPIVHWYGHSERAILASANPGGGGFTPWPTYGHAEFVSPNEEGLVEVIGTSFHNRMMPLIRYRTGDYARGIAKAASGVTSVESFVGRTQEFLLASEGRRISLTALNMHTDVFDGFSSIQFFQDTPGSAELRYVKTDSFDPGSLARIERQLREKLGWNFQLDLREVSQTERTVGGKHKWLSTTLISRENLREGTTRHS